VSAREQLARLHRALESHPAVRSAALRERDIRCELKGYAEVHRAPWMLCRLSEDPRLIEVILRDVAYAPVGGRTAFSMASLNYRAKVGALGMDDDGEVSWRWSLPLPGPPREQEPAEPFLPCVPRVKPEEEFGPILDLVFRELLTSRRAVLQAILVDVGLTNEACERALQDLPRPGDGPGVGAGGRPQPFGSLRSLLTHLGRLHRTARDAHDSLVESAEEEHEAGSPTELGLRKVAQLEAELEARCALSPEELGPKALVDILRCAGEVRGRLLGFLAARAIHTEEYSLRPGICLRRLGAAIEPETWPREAAATLELARALVKEESVVAGAAFEPPDQSWAEVSLDSYLQLAQAGVDALLESLGAEGLGPADERNLRRRLEHR